MLRANTGGMAIIITTMACLWTYPLLIITVYVHVPLLWAVQCEVPGAAVTRFSFLKTTVKILSCRCNISFLYKYTSWVHQWRQAGTPTKTRSPEEPLLSSLRPTSPSPANSAWNTGSLLSPFQRLLQFFFFNPHPSHIHLCPFLSAEEGEVMSPFSKLWKGNPLQLPKRY